jgi:hypothetical protein
MSRPKECHYFARDSVFARGPEFHNSIFCASSPVPYYGESSTIHCISSLAIGRIKECLFNPKIIFLIRNPIDRTISHYRWLYSKGTEQLPFKKAISKYGYTFDPELPEDGCYKAYIEFSRYSVWIPRWIKAFGEDSILIIRSEELLKNRQEVLKACSSFLRIQPIASPAENINQTRDVVGVKKSSFSRLAHKYLPARLKNSLRSSSLLTLAWRRSQYVTSQIVPPDISACDRDLIGDMLSEDLVYYNHLFGLN